MSFTKKIISWYLHNKRDLPWRETKDPYKIWVSEIILQQTRIDQGMAYYYRFLEQFRTIRELAAAPEEKVLKIWQGLGYYTRARNMHATANEIVIKYHGVFPQDYDSILRLKGIGKYTAAAIGSLAFGLPYAVIDGNVLRFLSRFFGIEESIDHSRGKKIIEQLAGQWMDRKNPGNYNQALMEFGALQCVPGNPDCSVCPIKSGCAAFAQGKTNVLPVRSKSLIVRQRYFNYLVLLKSKKNKTGKIWLRKRTGNDIWKNLYDFPLIESKDALSEKKLASTPEWKKLFQGKPPQILKIKGPFKHVLTHQVINATFYIIQHTPDSSLPYLEISIKSLENYPMPRLIEKFVKDLRNFIILHVNHFYISNGRRTAEKKIIPRYALLKGS